MQRVLGIPPRHLSFRTRGVSSARLVTLVLDATPFLIRLARTLSFVFIAVSSRWKSSLPPCVVSAEK